MSRLGAFTARLKFMKCFLAGRAAAPGAISASYGQQYFGSPGERVIPEIDASIGHSYEVRGMSLL